ncbi:MAG: Gfo/Idh/MocA family protein [Candidatus Humimicrobiaceae bacterium]
MSSRCNIGLIGAGWIGSEHGRNILKNKNAELIAIADESKENATRFMKENNIEVKYYKDYQAMLKNDDIDAVVISTPNNTHKEITISAAQAKKHTMCEKPMAITLNDCREIKKIVKDSGIKYLIGYHRRFNPLYSYVKNISDKGELGKLFYIESDYIHYVPPDLPIFDWLGKEDIAGSIFHAGCGHSVDLMRFFMGDAKEVCCFKDTYHPRALQVETEDTAIASIRFENGAIGKSFLGFGAITPFNFSFSLYGTKATVRNNRIWFDWIPRFFEVGHEEEFVELPKEWIPDNKQGGIAETWDKSINHFIDAVANNKPTLNDVDSAYRTSELVFAILKSANEKKIVELPLQ